MLGQLLVGWIPERRVWRWLVLALYAALFVCAVVLAVRQLA